MRRILVETPGLFSTIQDRGRYGYQRYGIPPSGAMDEFAFQVANILVGNKRNAAGIEVTLAGFSAKFDGDFEIAVTGADLRATLNGQKMENWRSVYVKRGDLLKFEEARKGCRAYLCVSGGIDVPMIFGSRSTYRRINMGGYHGRKLQRGDALPVGELSVFQMSPMKVDSSIISSVYSLRKIRVILGPESKRFSKRDVERLLSSPYHVTTQSDRMGYRLKGPLLNSKKRSHDIISNGIVTGAIQVPANGQPIIMMVEHQTVGGYAKIATVISADIPLLAQMKPGDEIHFERTTLEKAQKSYKQMQDILELLEDKSRKRQKGKVFFVEIGEKTYRLKIHPKKSTIPTYRSGSL